MFRTKAVSLALPPGSPHRINEPNYTGIRLFILRLMLFYSKQSMSIRAANVIYRRVVSQVDNPMVYDVFRLEKTFRTTFSMLVMHVWLCLRRLKVEGKEGVELGQYVYEIYNHDLEIRVSKAGVSHNYNNPLKSRKSAVPVQQCVPCGIGVQTIGSIKSSIRAELK
ncbi:putative ubiquinol-cytochrome c chaperone/UPF0174 [Helianthus annuus]|nr:putative ubiquinol-cytochrome c chaperone/UPF0174 [Helianthus annuus]